MMATIKWRWKCCAGMKAVRVTAERPKEWKRDGLHNGTIVFLRCARPVSVSADA